jgi:hypothetical protein
MSSSKTFTKRTNARRAAVQSGIPAELVEITVHKVAGEEPRFGFKRKDVVTDATGPAKAAGAAQAVPPVTTPTAPREERNGVRRPAPGGLCAAVWAYLDKHPTLTAKELKALAPKFGWNENNCAIEYYNRRKFLGLTKAAA